MQRADFPVVLDACVLANYGVCDLFLRLAETPRLYAPRWSARILDEAQRAQQQRLSPPWPRETSDSWRRALEYSFPEALVTGFEPLEASLTNDPGDRHVLAAAIRTRAEIIVTFNLRHFPWAALKAWGVSSIHPAEYLIGLYEIDPGIVVKRLVDIAMKRKQPPELVLARLARTIPAFAEHVAQAVGWDLPGAKGI
jgi:predicted nucleic acid-binding protein